jgi:hypothetical protein
LHARSGNDRAASNGRSEEAAVNASNFRRQKQSQSIFEKQVPAKSVAKCLAGMEEEKTM